MIEKFKLVIFGIHNHNYKHKLFPLSKMEVILTNTKIEFTIYIICHRALLICYCSLYLLLNQSHLFFHSTLLFLTFVRILKVETYINETYKIYKFEGYESNNYSLLGSKQQLFENLSEIKMTRLAYKSHLITKI